MKLPLTVLLLASLGHTLLAASPRQDAKEALRHWAFQKPVRPGVPISRSPEAVGIPIDAFIFDRLEREGLNPAPEADRPTLIRRASLDLTGLPPSTEEVSAFENDTAPNAFERVVDRLLSSPHYGERWGRWWLDAARYADSNGYSIDSLRSIWPYRDWVVRALNDDLPFDQFTIWQLAGDLRPESKTPDSSPRNFDPLIATGFHRNTQVNHEGGIDAEQFRIESAMDRVNTTATVWLGLTLGCAQCHDHKYDPLTQRDYYRFFAFFNQQENDGHGNSTLEAINTIELGSPQELAALAAFRDELKQREKTLDDWVDKELKLWQPAWEAKLDDDTKKKLKPEAQAALAVPTAERNEFQTGTAFNAFRDQDADYRERRKALDAFKKGEPGVVTTLVMREHSEPRETVVFIKGDFTRRGERVEPGTPAIFGVQTGDQLKREGRLPGRLELARWIVSAENPLTARVIMNRVWQQYFGKGLVETDNDFGLQGTRPSHPELLDWLATEFIARGWSLKAMQRLIVTSATYRQSSRTRPELAETDPGNKLIARQTRLRLDAELVRDVALSSSGLLDARLGGPPVFPPQPDGLDAFTQNKREWKTSTGGDRFRRGLYTHIQRTRFYPALAVFDAPDTYLACTRRLRSNTPLQALTLLNDQAFVEIARGFAARLLGLPARSDRERLERAFRFCVARSPQPTEAERLEQLIAGERHAAASELAVWTTVARVVLNLDEMITRE